MFVHVSACCAGGSTLAAGDTSGGQQRCGDENVDHYISIFSNLTPRKGSGKDTDVFRSSIDTQAVGGGSTTGANGHCSDFLFAALSSVEGTAERRAQRSAD